MLLKTVLSAWCIGILTLIFSANARCQSLKPETARILTGLDGFYTVATPAQIKQLIGSGSLAGVRDPDNKPEEALTPLMRAARESPYPEVIDLLIKAGADVNDILDASVDVPYGDSFKRIYVSSALHFAVLNENPEVLKALLRHKPNLAVNNEKRERFIGVLELAAMKKGRAEQLKILLEAGVVPLPGNKELLRPGIWQLFLGVARLNLTDDPFSAMNYATGLTNTPEEAALKTKILLDHGVAPDSDALCRALVGGQNRAAELLLEAGADPAWKDKDNQGALHAALTRPRATAAGYSKLLSFPVTDPDIVRRLMAHNDVRADDSLLTLACKSGQSAETVRALVEAGAAYSTEENSLLIHAVNSPRDCADLVEYLLSLGFSPIDKGKGNEEPLRTASRVPEKPLCAQALVRAGAQPGVLRNFDPEFAIEAGLVSADGRVLISPPPLSEAEQKRLEAKKLKIIEEMRQNRKDALYSSLFYWAATPEDVKEVIGGKSVKAVRTFKTEESVSFSGGSASYGLVVALPVLIFKKEFWTGKRTVKTKVSALAEAAGATPYPEVIHMLVRAGCKAKDLDSEPVFMSLFNPEPKVLEALLSYKPSLKHATFYLGMPLYYLAGSDRVSFKKEHFRLLLEAGADPNAASGQNRDTPLMQAAYYGNLEAGRMLLAAGAETAFVNRMGDSALTLAIKAEAWELATDILNDGAPLRSKYGRCALQRLADNPNADPVFTRSLLAATGPESDEARAAFMDAAASGNTALLELLLESRAGWLKEQDVLNKALRTALKCECSIRCECAEKTLGAVKLLLRIGANPNCTTGHGTPFISTACLQGSLGQVEALIRAGADVNQLDDDGAPPILYLADSNRWDEPQTMAVAEMLIKAGADMKKTGDNYWSPLAYVLKYPAAVEFFIKAGASLEVRNADGAGILGIAADRWESTDSIPLLLKAGARPDVADASGRTPLQVAMKYRNGKAVAFLLGGL